MPLYKTKRHLGRGKHYGFWQIRKGKTECYYFEPNTLLEFSDCILSNQVTAATNTFTGKKNKQPCAWIKSKTWKILPAEELATLDLGNPVFYNPRKAPYWTDKNGNNVDKLEAKKIVTVKKIPYIQPATVIVEPSLF